MKWVEGQPDDRFRNEDCAMIVMGKGKILSVLVELITNVRSVGTWAYDGCKV